MIPRIKISSPRFATALILGWLASACSLLPTESSEFSVADVGSGPASKGDAVVSKGEEETQGEESSLLKSRIENEINSLIDESLVVGRRGGKRLIVTGFEGIVPKNALLRSMFDQTKSELSGRIVQRQDGNEGFGIAGTFEYPFTSTDEVGSEEGKIYFDFSGRALASFFDNDTDGKGYLSGALGMKIGGLLASSASNSQSDPDYDKLFNALNESETIDHLEDTDGWRDYREHLQQAVGSFIYTEAGLFAGVEASQNLHERQFMAGATWYWEPFGYGSSQANFLDWLGASIRKFTEYDKHWEPRFLPSVRYNFAFIAPLNETPRREVGDDTDYWRGDLNISYSTPLARNGDRRYFLDAEWHFFHELEAGGAVKDADLDDFYLFTTKLRSSEGIYFAWRTGQMVFDRVDRNTIEFGWIVRF